jgi:hypothetical protein
VLNGIRSTGGLAGIETVARHRGRLDELLTELDELR